MKLLCVHRTKIPFAEGMRLRSLFCIFCLPTFIWANSPETIEFPHFKKAPHEYSTRTPADAFSQIKDGIQTGAVKLDHSSSKAYLISLLRSLGISPSTQTLVFSTTSLQLSRISPSNPRSIYFNEDIYLGWVPGGKIEVLGIDPDWGAITYIFDVPRPGSPPSPILRATRCMNCHASPDIGGYPGLLVSSVVPGPGGGSLDSFRQEETGHGVALEDRFGGWHLTGKHNITKHWGNLTGTLSPKGMTKFPNEPGQRFSLARYPVPTSDVLAHLLFEHQVGFVNRFIAATYRARAVLSGSVPEIGEKDTPGFLEREAKGLVVYLLFADEVSLEDKEIDGDSDLVRDFRRKSKKASDGSSLRDFDLQSRIFRFRCSYMIYSASFSGLPASLKQRVFVELDRALSPKLDLPEYSYLPDEEKLSIRKILKETLTSLPKGWE